MWKRAPLRAVAGLARLAGLASLANLASLASLAGLAACGTAAPTLPTPPADRSVIVVVWDGLRPDAISGADTPNLARLRDAGSDFADNHSTYPTFTMMNSASFATGAFPDATGYYGPLLER
jgi:Type I phosphodiesterase / nucleotide pyrophosphatase